MNALWLLLLTALPNPNPWQAIKDSDGVQVWARAVPDSPVREVKAQSVIEAPVSRVWYVLGDLEHYTEFMPYVEEARVLSSAGADARYEYLRLDPPLVSKRDYVLKTTLEINEQTGVYVRRFQAISDRGPPPQDGTVRLNLVDGSWTLERIDATHTLATYWLHTDPGGSLPAWITNKANNTSVPDLLAAVRQRSLNPAWKR
jgi:hypothetical protein